jgi:TMEM175 potassium channel family protein
VILTESNRVEAFSDGVFAIVITLLVLDLKAPATRGAMLHDLLAQWPAYLAYLASFAYVGVIWINHHNLFTRIAWVNGGLLWRNLALLGAMSVLPFPTAVVSSAFQLRSHSDERTALILYGIVGVASAATWLLLFHFLSRSPRLLEREAHTAFFAGERHRAVIGVIAYAVAAACALWLPVAGLVIICVLPVFYGVTSSGWRRSTPEAP